MTASARAPRDRFAAAYRRGTVAELPRPIAPPPGFARRHDVSLRAAPPAGVPVALHGTVLTPTGSIASGYVVIMNDQVVDVATTAPAGARVFETDGVILPGLLDLHGHPEFNVFAAWEPPKQFGNRYQWRASKVYGQLVRIPQNTLATAVPPRTQIRYAEARALTGGVTAIQGANGTDQSHDEPLVRNVDRWIFGAHRARAMIDLPSNLTGRGGPDLAKVLAGITAGDVDAFYLHLCEGAHGDQRSATEFQHFLDLGAATPKTVVIHGCALDEGQLDQLAAHGCKLVWSPQSNLRLYGQTTLAAHAMQAGMPVALGADWLPSGSTSLLAEMKVARRELVQQGHPLPAAELVRMVTETAADIAGLGDHLGRLAPGRPADVLVLERTHDDPYETVCQADPSHVQLVMIGGDVCYSRADWFVHARARAAAGDVRGPHRVGHADDDRHRVREPGEQPDAAAVAGALAARRGLPADRPDLRLTLRSPRVVAAARRSGAFQPRQLARGGATTPQQLR